MADVRDCHQQLVINHAAGFDERQLRRLKRKNIKKIGMTEVNYWEEVYKICFPDVPESDIPSACKSRKSSNALNYLTVGSLRRFHFT
jgi:hypothetical protein